MQGGYDPRFPPSLQDPPRQPGEFQQPYQQQQPYPQQQPYQQQQPYPQQQPYQPQQPYYAPPQTWVKPPGQTMVRVAGILMTIFGAIAFLSSLANLLAEGFSSGNTSLFGAEFSAAALFLFDVLVSGLTLTYGIIGIVQASDPHKGILIVRYGISLIAIRAVSLIIALGQSVPLFQNYGDNAAFIGGVISGVVFVTAIGCILPILYIVGGNKLKNAQ